MSKRMSEVSHNSFQFKSIMRMRCRYCCQMISLLKLLKNIYIQAMASTEDEATEVDRAEEEKDGGVTPMSGLMARLMSEVSHNSFQFTLIIRISILLG